MGLFSNLFKSEPSRDEWITISASICEGLEGYIDIWYAICVKALQDRGDEEIVNAEVTDGADMAIRAYQLMMAMTYIGKNQYISPKNGADFADILYANYCGTRLNQITDFGRRYMESSEYQIQRFCGDVSTAILGRESAIGMIALTPHILTLGLGGNVLISAAFGDNAKAQEMSDNLTEYNQ